jgi:hypothetical protein
MRDYQQASGGRHAKRHKAPFIDRMVRAVTGCRQGVKKHAGSFLERYTVLAWIVAAIRKALEAVYLI